MGNPRTAEAGAVSGTDIENIDLALGELNLDEAGDTTEVIETLNEADEAALDVEIEKEKAYDAQEVTTTDVTPAEPAKPAKAAKEKAEKKERTPRDINALPDDVFTVSKSAPADKAAVIATRPNQKKVAEKFDNLFQSLAAGKRPSVYVMACFDALVAAGEVKSTDLVATLKATSSKKGSGYSEGTARSQAGQIMNLFATVGIAVREKQTLKINQDSAIVEKLKALPAA